MEKRHNSFLITLKYSMLVFAAGVAYGSELPLVRAAQMAGFDTSDILKAQYLFAALFLGIFALIFARAKINFKQFLQLALIGALSTGLSFGYYNAMKALPPATAVTLLFQFAWMGVVLQAIVEHKLPSRTTVFAVLIILVGTFLATGVFEPQNWGKVTLPGILFGILSALCYTFFLFFSGRFATTLPTASRAFVTTIGSIALAFMLAPSFFVAGAVQQGVVQFLQGMAIFMIPLAVLGILVPLVLVQVAAPHLQNGVVSIMAASELPAGIVMAALFLNEEVSALVIVGVVVVLAGIVLSQYDSLRQSRKQTSI